ncbi:hypothetical protein GQ55_3G462400 [Panicum hallii var. hallii]|uniref:Uncharacterized protein n=1 Tax=Panicum hallii var. hallii TaxID=1504633 RepID=A0A2T7EIX6_9POAL|nr:hypothetical protein GQ55_3G462400 [Panicum hallii var. hallii]
MAPPPKNSDSAAALQAAIDGNLSLLKELAGKVNLRDAEDAKGRNALHFAAVKGHLEVCRFLVEESGLDVNSVSGEGRLPVHCAAAGGSDSVLRYLLDHGGDPAVPDHRRSMPLHDAAELGHFEAVRLLLSKGVDVDPINYIGTPLHLAASKDQDQAVKILLEHGADPKRVVNHVFTPLFMAACCGHSLKCTKQLVEAGADVNFTCPWGPIILMEAVDDGLTDIVKFLLEAGADPNIANEDGRFPIMWAAGHGHRELVEILFPQTKPIPSIPDWSVDGILRAMKYLHLEVQDAALVAERLADAESQGKKAFANGEYFASIHYYGLAVDKDPLDATLFANMSLCWLRMREGERALEDARKCKMMRPGWSKAWYREGTALSFLKKYNEAIPAFMQAQKLDPTSDEIEKALTEAIEVVRSAP